MQLLRTLWYRIWPWSMCRCTFPMYEVRNGVLVCSDCNKPVNKKTLEGAM